MTPSQTIRAARMHLGLTQPEFASLLGHNAVTISRWETGVFDPNPYDVTLAAQLMKSNVKRAGVLLVKHGPIYTLGRLLGS